jgi:GT2 family glycosyltransferase
MSYLLSIVIVTYKADEYIYDCLNSIIKYNDIGMQLKIVVVDNSPTECSIVEKCSILYSNVLFIANPANTGFGAANNIGAKAVDSDYILFFNNDTELIEPVFRKIIAQFIQNQKLGCLSIRQEGGGPSYFQRSPTELTKKEIRRIKKKRGYDSRIHFLSGAFLFFSRVAFEKCGRFDENFFMYFEEQDILNRLYQCGYESYYDNDSCFLHKLGGRKSLNEKIIYAGNESLYYYLIKYNFSNPKKKYFKRLCNIRWLIIHRFFHFKMKEIAILVRALKKTRKDYSIYKVKYSNMV